MGITGMIGTIGELFARAGDTFDCRRRWIIWTARCRNCHLRAFKQWHAQAVAAGGGAQPHWLVNVGGLAHALGDVAQLAAIRHALAWGSGRAWVSAVLIGEPADYEGGVGLRAANGRTRLALGQITMTANAMRALR